MKNEFHLIKRLKSLIPRSLQGSIPIGDDAGIFRAPPDKSLLFTTDVIVEGVDFLIGKRGASPPPAGTASPEEIGHKALAVNLSDIAAMGGRPLAFVSTWGIPKKFPEKWVERAAKEMLHLTRRFKVDWVGGDISRANQVFISIAMVGRASKKVVLRKGAKPGDFIYVTGKLGGSIKGKHLSFTPRILEGQFLASRFTPTAMIDISDGFVQDLGHLLKASKVGARVELESIPISNAAWRGARRSRRRALQSALSYGEDFELLFTLRPAQRVKLEKAWRKRFPGVLLSCVGEVTNSKPGKIDWFDGRKPLTKLWFQKTGFAHF